MTSSNINNAVSEFVYIYSLLRKTRQNHALALLLFEKLFLEVPEQLLQLEESLKAEDLNSAFTITHKLHGSFSFCDFAQLQKSCHVLEKRLLARDLANAQHDFLELKQQVTDFKTLEISILAYFKN